MLQLPAGGEASQGSVRYERHRPERTLPLPTYRRILSRIFDTQWAAQGRVVAGLRAAGI